MLIGLLLTVVFQFAAARRHHIGRAAPGAFTVSVLWLGLQLTGAVYTKQVLAGTDGMNATFGLVLGLIGLIYFAAIIGVIGIEVNVVLERRLWPRALTTLFTDKVSADRGGPAGVRRLRAGAAAQDDRGGRGALHRPGHRRGAHPRRAGTSLSATRARRRS